MIRFAIASLVVLALGIGLAWLAGHSGGVVLEIGDLRVETTVLAAAVAVAFVIFVSVLAHHAWRWLRHGPSRFGSSRASRRRREGYLALTRGFVAVAAGEVGEAKRHATQAAKLMRDPPLTLLLSAQAAQLAGEEAEAERHFTAMLQQPETEFLGLRGLLAQAVRRGERGRALELAERARALKPKTPWLLRELFQLQAAEQRWIAAEATLAEAIRAKAIPADEGRHRQAVLIFQRAESAAREGRNDEARKLAEQAQVLAPDFVPAILLAADMQRRRGKVRKAAKLLFDGYARMPHPDVIAAYMALSPSDDPAAKLKRMRDLTAGAPEHMESRLALAEAALSAGDFPLVREQLKPLVGERPSPRAARLMAELDERQYGDGLSARQWLLRAASASPDPTWLCAACGGQNERWAIRCAACGGFDTLHWKRPPGPADLAPALEGRVAAGAPASLPKAPAEPAAATLT